VPKVWLPQFSSLSPGNSPRGDLQQQLSDCQSSLGIKKLTVLIQTKFADRGQYWRNPSEADATSMSLLVHASR
jgi:hypothetical protein